MLGVGCNAAIKRARQATENRGTFGFVCCPLSEEEVGRGGGSPIPWHWNHS